MTPKPEKKVRRSGTTHPRADEARPTPAAPPAGAPSPVPPAGARSSRAATEEPRAPAAPASTDPDATAPTSTDPGATAPASTDPGGDSDLTASQRTPRRERIPPTSRQTARIRANRSTPPPPRPRPGTVESPMIPPAPRPADFGDALGEADVPATHRSSDRVIVANPTRTRAPIPSAPEVVATGPSSTAPTSRQPHLPDGELTPGYDLDGETVHEVAPVAATAPALNRDSEPPVSRGPESGPTASQRAAGAEAITVEELESQIRDLESRLDRMIRDKTVEAPAAPPSVPPPRPSAPASREPTDEAATVFDTARELLSTDYYLRQWGRMGMRNRSEEVDEFGLDPKYEARWRPFFDFLYRHYFRVDVEGTARIPDEGRCLIVSNHSGGPLPYDGAMLRATVKRDHPAAREVRWLAEDFVYYLPFLGAVMNRLGAVRACQENAERLLARGAAVAVFPEGAKGMGKLYKDRYRLQRFGRGGFIRLALRTRTPIVPTAIVGAEEANPIVYRIESFTKAFGLPYLPITPTFPALGPLGLLPAPTKWKVRFGEPMSFDEHGPGAADDDILVGRLADRVRGAIQGMLDDTLASRTSIWFG